MASHAPTGAKAHYLFAPNPLLGNAAGTYAGVTNWGKALRHTISNRAAVGEYGRWLTSNAPSDVQDLELVVLTVELSQQPRETQGARAIALCKQYLMAASDIDEEAAVPRLREVAGWSLSRLSSTSYPRFVRSKSAPEVNGTQATDSAMSLSPPLAASRLQPLTAALPTPPEPDWAKTLRRVINDREEVGTFGRWLTREAPADVPDLELVALASELLKVPADARAPTARQLCRRYLNMEPERDEEALSAVAERAGAALSQLASTSFRRFVRAKAYELGDERAQPR